MKIAIVGAGIAGLACADALAAAGHTLTLFDKGRAPGGRMSTRRIATPPGSGAAVDVSSDAHFDHGAQYFTVRDPAFRAQVDRWHRAGLVAPWPAAGPDAWVGIPAMTSPARDMATRHDVRFPVEITTLQRDANAWLIEGDRYDTLLLALPAENTARLLQTVHPTFAALAEATPSAPCWTVMAAFPERLAAPDILRDPTLCDPGPVGWAARNSAKPGRTGPESWVIQAGPDWSRSNLEREKQAIIPPLLEALAARLGAPLPPALATAAHRWRYARSGNADRGTLWDPTLRLGVCGDWLLGPRIEATWRSATQLAQTIT